MSQNKQEYVVEICDPYFPRWVKWTGEDRQLGCISTGCLSEARKETLEDARSTASAIKANFGCAKGVRIRKYSDVEKDSTH